MSEPQQDLKSIIRQEYIKSATDPIHFFKKYCYIQHPQRGRILFNLYPFQEKVFKLLTQDQDSIIIKSRQLGISTLVAGYTLWLMLFHKDKNILCIATKQETAKNMVTKVQFMYENLPSWLSIPYSENNKLNLKLSNGSQIKATSAASDAGRSEAVSMLLIDEAAFIDNIETIWTSAQQTLSTGGKCIAISTPNGTGNWFHQTYTKAEAGDNNFVPIKLPWYVHPERDQKWRDKQDIDLGPKMAAQECNCDFATSGDTVFYSEHIDYYEKTYQADPIERRGIDKNLWIWENADYNRSYLISADVARGDGQDFSTAHVIDIENNVQVAEYKGQIGTKEFGHMLVALATEYNEALLVIENASIGWAVIQVVIDRAYPNLYYSPRAEYSHDTNNYYDKYMDTSKMVAGINTSVRLRPMMIGKLQEYINERGVIIQSKRLITEMKTFIWKNGRAEAQYGYNDDLIMAFAIAMYIRDTALISKQRGIDISKQVLNNMHVNKTNYQGMYSNNLQNNPYRIETGYGNEDISWLIR